MHPLHVESVAWVAERKDVLSTFWWVLTTSAYVAFIRRPHAWRYGALVLCFGLALMSKPMVVTLPFLLLLLDVWPLGRWQGLGAGEGRIGTWALVREKAPLFLMAAVAAVITFIAQRQAGAVQSLDVLPLSAAARQDSDRVPVVRHAHDLANQSGGALSVSQRRFRCGRPPARSSCYSA